MKTIVVCRFGAIKNFPIASGAGTRPPEGVVVELEGAASVDETKEEAHLIDALSGITGGEYVYFDSMPHPLIRARHGLDHDGSTHEMRQANARILKGFADEHLEKAAVSLQPQPAGGGSKWVLMTRLSDEDIVKRLMRVGGIDGNFLGAPIVVGSESDAKLGPF